MFSNEKKLRILKQKIMQLINCGTSSNFAAPTCFLVSECRPNSAGRGATLKTYALTTELLVIRCEQLFDQFMPQFNEEKNIVIVV